MMRGHIALLFATCLLVATECRITKNVKLRIIHLNDVHNRIESASSTFAPCSATVTEASGLCYGGWARILTAVKQARKDYPATLVLDAGDEFMGTVYDSYYRGQATPALQNQANIQAMTIGNHEFDYGTKDLADYIKQLNFPLLGACNVDVSRNQHLAGLLKHWTVIDIPKKKLKVAVVGVLTESTAFSSGQLAGSNITFTDALPALKACVANLRAQEKGLDLVIALTHVGYSVDLELAQQVPGIDLIIGGHTHTFLAGPSAGSPGPLLNIANNKSYDVSSGGFPTPVQSLATPGKVVPVVQAMWASRYLGNLELQLKPGQGLVSVVGRPVLLGGRNSSNNVEPDPGMTAYIRTQLAPPVEGFSQVVIGSATVEQDIASARVSESNMLTTLCDAMSWYVHNQTDLEAKYDPVHICLNNGGIVRSGLPEGNLTNANAIEALPYGNLVSVKTVRGDQLVASLEGGLNQVGTQTNTGRFPQVTGMKYAYDGSKPPGQRLLYVKLLGEDGQEFDLDPCQEYNVVTNSYIGGGGDGYDVLKATPYLLETGPTMLDALVGFIQAASPISTQVDGHIVACHLQDQATNPMCTKPMPKPMCVTASSQVFDWE